MRSVTTRSLLAALLSLALVGAACGEEDSGAEAADCEVDQTDGDLNIFNWAEYIDPDLLDAFAAEYGVGVTIDVYDSNEAMQPIISAGNSGYDLIVPSDYMVAILIEGEDIQPLNKDAIPNAANISPDFENLIYDPDGAYSLPYQWGTTGIAVDTAVVGTDFPRSWSIIFDPSFADAYSGRISLLNDPRETLGAALKYLGYSLNTTDDDELEEAKDLVAEARGRVAAFDTDQADELLTTGETAIAHGYSGDMFTQFLETDDPSRYVYFVPEEGGTRWIDNMAIPHDAPNPCTAHTFINWLLDGENGAALSNYNYYSTPNEAALDGLDEDLLDFVNDPAVIPGGVGSLEEIQDTGDFEIKYTDAFIEAVG
ncbi:MAG: spermidine/putrescine ABC transporter substrate-binding protein [bacterium]|nr:spermidine/putrescine ABC transporter substrate-binding protein [bacterium]MDE0439337.1 spermidine/putrescine ABC transporter substrate-binding protein [bacterium]